MIRRPPRSTQSRSSAASDVYKRQISNRCPEGTSGTVCWARTNSTRLIDIFDYFVDIQIRPTPERFVENSVHFLGIWFVDWQLVGIHRAQPVDDAAPLQ